MFTESLVPDSFQCSKQAQYREAAREATATRHAACLTSPQKPRPHERSTQATCHWTRTHERPAAASVPLRGACTRT
jgi:hypothetical protein